MILPPQLENTPENSIVRRAKENEAVKLWIKYSNKLASCIIPPWVPLTL